MAEGWSSSCSGCDFRRRGGLHDCDRTNVAKVLTVVDSVRQAPLSSTQQCLPVFFRDSAMHCTLYESLVNATLSIASSIKFLLVNQEELMFRVETVFQVLARPRLSYLQNNCSYILCEHPLQTIVYRYCAKHGGCSLIL